MKELEGQRRWEKYPRTCRNVALGGSGSLWICIEEIRNQKSEILYLAHWPTIINAYEYTYNVNGPWAGRLPKDCNISRYHGSHPTEIGKKKNRPRCVQERVGDGGAGDEKERKTKTKVVVLDIVLSFTILYLVMG